MTVFTLFLVQWCVLIKLKMPPTSLVNIIALGLVGVVAYGIFTFFNSYSSDYQLENRHRSDRSSQRKAPPSRKDNTCFCEDDRVTNCTLMICGHRFHKECLKQWAEERSPPDCPFDREEFNFQLDVKSD